MVRHMFGLSDEAWAAIESHLPCGKQGLKPNKSVEGRIG